MHRLFPKLSTCKRHVQRDRHLAVVAIQRLPDLSQKKEDRYEEPEWQSRASYVKVGVDHSNALKGILHILLVMAEMIYKFL